MSVFWLTKQMYIQHNSFKGEHCCCLVLMPCTAILIWHHSVNWEGTCSWETTSSWRVEILRWVGVFYCFYKLELQCCGSKILAGTICVSVICNTDEYDDF